jgi:transposase
MAIPVGTEALLAAKFAALFPHLDERQRRLVAGAEARSLGHGGIRVVARAAGMREGTVSDGVAELESGAAPLGRVRRAGGGRKKATEMDPGLVSALLALVEPEQRGDPMSPLRWTIKSTRVLAGELSRQGHAIGPDTVARLLREEGFSLQANAKVQEGRQHPDRDAQFRYINTQAQEHRSAGEPVVSIDAKKKELVGSFKNPGRSWERQGEPVRVDCHDFPGEALGKALPYGIYDAAANAGWVNVGTDHDTAAFAVESLRRWWSAAGKTAYPHARRLLITADAGGSNGYRTRAWKTQLSALAAETGLDITVCHFPPGTSKWNAIEHRLFSHITMNWRGRPLTSHEVVINSIAATTTRTGLKVHAELDTDSYPTGVEVSDEQIAAVPITRHRFHGDWNYTLHQAPTRQAPPTGPGTQDAPRRLTFDELSDPELTGMPRPKLEEMIRTLAPALGRARERTLYERRGKRTSLTPGTGTGAKAKLTPAQRILATVLHQRKLATHDLLGELFNVAPMTTSRVVRDVLPVLTAHGYQITPSTARLRTPADVTAFLAYEATDHHTEIKPAC